MWSWENKPDIDLPQPFPTSSADASISLLFSDILSIRQIASYKHFAMSRIAITSPFSTTGRCLNFPVNKIIFLVYGKV